MNVQLGLSAESIKSGQNALKRSQTARRIVKDKVRDLTERD